MTYNEKRIYFASDYVISSRRRPRLFRRVCSRNKNILTTTPAPTQQTKIFIIYFRSGIAYTYSYIIF